MTRELLKPTDCPYYLISRLTLAATSTMKKLLADSGVEAVRPAYMGALMALWEEDGLKVTELGRRAGLAPSTMTGLIDRMERDGLVTRRDDVEDRRIQNIFLTEFGRGARDVILDVVDKTLSKVFAGIAPTDLENTKDVLRRALANAHEESEK